MDKLEKTLTILNAKPSQESAPVSALCVLMVTLVFSFCVLSVPVYDPVMLLWYSVYPIVCSAWYGISFGRLFVRSLIILPFAVLIGVFNPIMDTTPAFTVGSVTVTQGWLSFTSIILRSLLAMQAVLMLISTHGFEGLCRGLSRLHVPSFIVDQLLFVYRYLTVLIEEALSMKRAREARGFGRGSFPMKMWAQFIGQLFLRTIGRADRIHAAMCARRFDGRLPQVGMKDKWHRGDTIFLVLCTALFIILRFVNLSCLFTV